MPNRKPYEKEAWISGMLTFLPMLMPLVTRALSSGKPPAPAKPDPGTAKGTTGFLSGSKPPGTWPPKPSPGSAFKPPAFKMPAMKMASADPLAQWLDGPGLEKPASPALAARAAKATSVAGPWLGRQFSRLTNPLRRLFTPTAFRRTQGMAAVKQLHPDTKGVLSKQLWPDAVPDAGKLPADSKNLPLGVLRRWAVGKPIGTSPSEMKLEAIGSRFGGDRAQAIAHLNLHGGDLDRAMNGLPSPVPGIGAQMASQLPTMAMYMGVPMAMNALSGSSDQPPPQAPPPQPASPRQPLPRPPAWDRGPAQAADDGDLDPVAPRKSAADEELPKKHFLKRPLPRKLKARRSRFDPVAGTLGSDEQSPPAVEPNGKT